MEYEVTKAFNIINGLVNFLSVEDKKIETMFGGITDRLERVESALSGLNLKENIERDNNQSLTEIEDDWEPFIEIEIDNQKFLAHCDIGSMMSTMPKMAVSYTHLT